MALTGAGDSACDQGCYPRGTRAVVEAALGFAIRGWRLWRRAAGIREPTFATGFGGLGKVKTYGAPVWLVLDAADPGTRPIAFA